jgi:hypothetical protein
MAPDCIFYFDLELFQSICLRENRMSHGARFVTAFRRFLDRKDYFGIHFDIRAR